MRGAALACALLLALHATHTCALVLPDRPSSLRRGRLLHAPASGSAVSSRRDTSEKCASSSWGGAAVGAAAGSSSDALPGSTSYVLICLISSGVHTDAAALRHNRWSGCAAQDGLDPAGCLLPWAAAPSDAGFKPRGSWVAAIIAAKDAGVIPGGTDIHVVPVDGPASGSLDPASTAPNGRSRLRAYSVCEGRLRGLQAQEYRDSSGSRQRWRMVVLADVIADKPAVTGQGEFELSEAAWLQAALGQGSGEAAHMPDVLFVAPAGQRPAVGYPAALPRVIGVGAHKCNGDAARTYSSGSRGKPDILAPGVNIATLPGAQPWSDTTAAAAFVAGAAARLWNAHPGCGADAIRAALLSSSGGSGSSSSSSSSGGPPRLSLPAATAALKQLGCAKQQAS